MNTTVMPNAAEEQAAKKNALLVYILQAASCVIFITWIVALIVNYVKRDDVKNTLAETHFTWQIKTFWYGLLWAIVGSITVWVGIGFVVWFVNYIWLIYRIVKGIIYLNDEKAYVLILLI